MVRIRKKVIKKKSSKKKIVADPNWDEEAYQAALNNPGIDAEDAIAIGRGKLKI